MSIEIGVSPEPAIPEGLRTSLTPVVAADPDGPREAGIELAYPLRVYESAPHEGGPPGSGPAQT